MNKRRKKMEENKKKYAFDIDRILDQVPVLKIADLPPGSKQPRANSLPKEKVLKIYLEANASLRMRITERKAKRFTCKSIAEQNGVSIVTVSAIANRRLGWDLIRDEVAEMIARGENTFLLEPRFAK